MRWMGADELFCCALGRKGWKVEDWTEEDEDAEHTNRAGNRGPRGRCVRAAKQGENLDGQLMWPTTEGEGAKP